MECDVLCIINMVTWSVTQADRSRLQCFDAVDWVAGRAIMG